MYMCILNIFVTSLYLSFSVTNPSNSVMYLENDLVSVV